MTHTKGPWRIGDAGHTVFGPPTGNPSPETVATLAKSESWRSNARLIAAAPDMYKELRILEVEMGGWLEDPDIHAYIHDEILSRLMSVRVKLEQATT